VLERLGLADPAHRPNLAIASCGNAALAAAVVAAAGGRVLDVFVPVEADSAVIARLKALDARVTVCPREAGVPGDPTYHRLRRALAEGELPFTCQGNENGIAVEGGFTLGYEIAAALAGGPALDRLVVQVGGGALASACIESIDDSVALGVLPAMPRVHTVQTEGAWPLRRAFDRVAARLPAGATPVDVQEALSYAATHRSEFMWPWEEEPHSVAHGILDDETYDWLAVVEGMLRTGGSPVVVDEDLLVHANELAVSATGIDVDPTGSSGLAGLIALRDGGEIGDHERIAALFTGVRR
jgi:threonine synthase